MNGYNHLSVGKNFTRPGWKYSFHYWWESRLTDRKWKLQERGGAAVVIRSQSEVKLHLSHMAAFQTLWESYSTGLTNRERIASSGQAVHVWLDFMIFNM